MPYSAGVFTRLYSWVVDKANSININATRMDAEMNGMASALSLCVLKDGTQTITAALPMAGFNHTGVGNATARDQYATAGQIQDSSLTYCGTATGTANAITLSPTPVITSYTAGKRFQFIASAANTSTVTVNVSSLGTKALTKYGTTALSGGEIASGAIIDIEYDGTQFQIVNPNDLGASVKSTITMSGAAINEAAEVSIAASGTPAIGAAASNNILLTGGGVTTAFDTVAAGIRRHIRWAGATTLQYNGTSLILPGGANITTAANDTAEAESLGSGNWIVTSYSPASGNPVVSQVVYSSITGLTPSGISGSSTTATVSINNGQATDSTNTKYLVGSSLSWGVANGNAINGYQGGTTLPNSSTIHFYICSGASGTGTFASTSLTPTLPSGYNSFYRRMFSLPTNSSGALLGGTPIEQHGGGMLFYLTTQVLDVSRTDIVSANRTLSALGSVPTGIKVKPLIRGGTLSAVPCLFTSPDETDVACAAAISSVPSYDVDSASGNTVIMQPDLITNTSAQIGFRASSGTGVSLYVTTRGWVDFRRA